MSCVCETSVSSTSNAPTVQHPAPLITLLVSGTNIDRQTSSQPASSSHSPTASALSFSRRAHPPPLPNAPISPIIRCSKPHHAAARISPSDVRPAIGQCLNARDRPSTERACALWTCLIRASTTSRGNQMWNQRARPQPFRITDHPGLLRSGDARRHIPVQTCKAQL